VNTAARSFLNTPRADVLLSEGGVAGLEAHAAPVEQLVIPDLPDEPLRRQVRA